MLKTFASNIDGVIRPGFMLQPEISEKIDNIFETAGF